MIQQLHFRKHFRGTKILTKKDVHPHITALFTIVKTWKQPQRPLTDEWINLCDICCSVTQLCPTLCDPMDCSKPGFPVHHHLQKHAQTHVHRVGDAIQISHPLLSPSPSALNLAQHQSLFHRVSSLKQVAKVLEFQPQNQPL